MSVSSIKVSSHTRERVKSAGLRTHQTAEQVINAALDELERRQRHDRMRQEAETLAQDSADLAEAQAILSDMESLRAW